MEQESGDYDAAGGEEDYELPGVFINSLVWRKLGRYLNFGDLKATRLVCREFNNQVITETNFKNRALVNLTIPRLKNEEFGTTTILWKHFKIQLLCFDYESHIIDNDETGKATSSPTTDDDGNGDENSLATSSSPEDWISPLLKCAESLEITVAPNVYGSKIRSYPTLDVLLEAPDRLKQLALDVNIFDTHENIVFSDLEDKIRSTLEHIIEFHIESRGFRIVTHHNDSQFTDSTGMLSTVMKNLKVLKVGHIVEEGIEGLPDTVDNELHLKIQNLIRMIEENKSHITHLHLEDMQLWSTTSDTSLCLQPDVVKKDFSSLKSVVIRANQIEKNNLLNFLARHHKTLEDIDISIFHRFPNEILHVIRSKFANLKRLRIKTKGFEDKEENIWNFLSKCEKLECFQLDFPISNRFSPNVESHNVIFMNLPKSIQSISLNGFFSDTQTLTSHDFSNLNPSLLTKLILKKSQGVVDDETLEWIFKNFKMIQVFTLTHNSSITDYGVTGMLENNENDELPLNTEEPSFSIKFLKGMKSLTLQSCSNITDKVCQYAIQFNELTFLDLSDNDCITEAGIMAVLKNNPSLEILKTSEFDLFPPEEDIKEGYPRLQTHIFTDGGGSDDEDDSLHHVFGDGSSDPDDFDHDDFYDDYEDEDDVACFDEVDYEDEDDDGQFYHYY